MLEINRALGGGAELNEVLGRALDALMAVFLERGPRLHPDRGARGKAAAAGAPPTRRPGPSSPCSRVRSCARSCKRAKRS